MFSIEEFIIAVFCCMDDLLQEITGMEGWGTLKAPVF